VCIGQPFALEEATLLLASIAQRYQLRMMPNYVVTPAPRLTLGVAGVRHTFGLAHPPEFMIPLANSSVPFFALFFRCRPFFRQ